MRMFWLQMKLVLSIGLILFGGCQQKESTTVEEAQAQLSAYRLQLSELRTKISDLERVVGQGVSHVSVNVTVDTVDFSLYEHFIDVMGMVHSDFNVVVHPEASGNIDRIVVKEGDRVRAGDVLAYLNSRSLDRSIDEASISLAHLQTLYERQQRLWAEHIGSEIEYLQAKSNKEAAEKRLESLKAQRRLSEVRAPLSGIVDDLFQRNGEIAGPSIPFARIVNLSDVYLHADVSERFLNRVHEGDSVWLHFPVLSKQMTGVVSRLSSVIDPNSRTFRIRVDMKNIESLLRPNMMSQVRMRVFRSEDALVVPSLIVKQDLKGSFLWIAKPVEGNWEARKRYVTVRMSYDNRSFIGEGLNPGDVIITEGHAQVVDGSRLEIFNQ